jgi:hypothetical protein
MWFIFNVENNILSLSSKAYFKQKNFIFWRNYLEVLKKYKIMINIYSPHTFLENAVFYSSNWIFES